jgi:hypothetical protein
MILHLSFENAGFISISFISGKALNIDWIFETISIIDSKFIGTSHLTQFNIGYHFKSSNIFFIPVLFTGANFIETSSYTFTKIPHIPTKSTSQKLLSLFIPINISFDGDNIS